MHEVPVPVDYKNSLSVSTEGCDNVSNSPVPGSASPCLSVGLGSPRPISPLGKCIFLFYIIKELVKRFGIGLSRIFFLFNL